MSFGRSLCKPQCIIALCAESLPTSFWFAVPFCCCCCLFVFFFYLHFLLLDLIFGPKKDCYPLKTGVKSKYHVCFIVPLSEGGFYICFGLCAIFPQKGLNAKPWESFTQKHPGGKLNSFPSFNQATNSFFFLSYGLKLIAVHQYQFQRSCCF